jgi:ferredoxin-NADP reductase
MADSVLTATVTGTRELTPHVRELTLRPDDGRTVAYLPGQWLSLRLPVGDRPPLVRAYSLAAAPAPDGTLTLCFDRVDGGLGSTYLWDLPVGATVEFSGPLGNLVLPEGDSALVMVARFTGVVPFRAMLQSIERGDSPPRPVHLVHGGVSDQELVYRSEFESLAARAPWFTYHPVLLNSEDSDEISVLRDNTADWGAFTPLLCGVREFTFPTRAYLMEAFGLDRRAVKVENYNGPAGR